MPDFYNNPDVADSAARVSASQAAGSTGSAQTDAGAGSRTSHAGSEAAGDINQTEAYIVNLKRLVEGALDHDGQLRTNASNLLSRVSNNSADFDQQLRSLANQALTNAVNLANRVNNNAIEIDERIRKNSLDHGAALNANAISERERTVRHGDVAGDRMWNVDEVAHLVAKNPVFMDAIAGAVAAAVAASVGRKE